MAEDEDAGRQEAAVVQAASAAEAILSPGQRREILGRRLQELAAQQYQHQVLVLEIESLAGLVDPTVSALEVSRLKGEIQGLDIRVETIQGLLREL